ncbi:hypothetical protein [Rhizobium leguminosarum]|uniref:hypothetical protein n=1 Tax=Rhizobium leguminosarum TaxID=384 RepID=UPI0014420236|nr:hypothetical protein [Rhizobium leguminosarum]MBY5864273.1 hypothetical protein [Rhizobium leguminosarum]NKM03290.1 hypothetical protein [Rhizobium leguminosarum bv. viciae]
MISALKPRLLVLALTLLGGIPDMAAAETVLLARGDDTFGQGWLFLDATGQCRVATPRHVIETSDGKLSTPDLLDSYGRIHPTHTPLTAPDPELDLAFVSVGGQIAREGCSRDRVRLTPLQPIIQSIKQAIVEIATPTERQSIPVALKAVSRDSEGGHMIALAPVDPQAPFQKGMSGGTVTHNGRPIAMLFEVDSEEGVGIAMRYDLIASELQKLAASPAKPIEAKAGSLHNLILLKGRLPQKDMGLSTFLSRESALQIVPAEDRITFVIEMDGSSVIKAVRLQGEGMTGQGSIIVEADNAGQGFSPGARCALLDDTTCTMSPRRVTRLRITLTGSAAATYKINKIDLVKGDT